MGGVKNADRREFLYKAIEEVQATNRFLDTKAGVLVVFESSLLAVLVSCLFQKSTFDLARDLVASTSTTYCVLLLAFFNAVALGLVYSILRLLMVISPRENPREFVDIGTFKPKGLFFLHKLDKGRIQPGVRRYSEDLGAMSDEDIIQELAYELLKLSYIRKLKHDRLASSFLLFGGLIAGLTVVGIMLACGMV